MNSLMNRCALIALTALLGACATGRSIDELISNGDRSVFELRQAPDLAAGCLARNIEIHRDGYSGNVRPFENGYEVVIMWSGAQRTALVRLEPAGTGSRATVYLRENYLWRRDEFLPALVAGC